MSRECLQVASLCENGGRVLESKAHLRKHPNARRDQLVERMSNSLADHNGALSASIPFSASDMPKVAGGRRR